jgi:anaerobic ribonucleoside-triphosphate reductase activating protein
MDGTIRIAGVVRESIVDGPGLRFTVFCQGCPHGCKGCHNVATHDFSGGYDCEMQKILDAIDQNPLLDGVTFSGGEPLCQPEAFYKLAVEIKKRNLNIMTYTGYTYEELLEMGREDHWVADLLSLIDLLVDGRFVEAERDLTLLFRGSRNQRIIDMNLTRERGEVTLAEKYI